MNVKTNMLLTLKYILIMYSKSALFYSGNGIFILEKNLFVFCFIWAVVLRAIYFNLHWSQTCAVFSSRGRNVWCVRCMDSY